MTPTEVRSMSDSAIVELLVSLKPSDQAVAWLASVITDDVAFEGVRELRRRFTSATTDGPATRRERMRCAHSVKIDRDRWNAFFWRRRITLADAGGLMEPPRSAGWASVVGFKGSTSFYALDDLACALGIHVDQIIREVGTDEELRRLSA